MPLDPERAQEWTGSSLVIRGWHAPRRPASQVSAFFVVPTHANLVSRTYCNVEPLRAPVLFSEVVFRTLELRSNGFVSAQTIQPPTSRATSSAIARHAVSPGDSMPKRCTKPATPWASGP